MMSMRIKMNCCFCGKAHNVVVSKSDYRRYVEGELVQRAFPYLNATEREQIVSGMCPKCQADLFGSDEDDFEDVSACMRESLESTGQWW